MRFMVLAVCCVAASPASAATTQEIANMSVRSWAAFECAALASSAGFRDEEDRLFKIAYDQATAFLQAYADGKIADSEVTKYGSFNFYLRMHDGPSIDFKLGVIWAVAHQIAHEDISKNSDGSDTSYSEFTDRAILKFAHRNCRSL
ncbi:hypothetical protein EN812_09630 [Mesorhizobium sp. M4B.F.Ca.ET.169.01.1.1]|uniref:hypothetical protein n=1 Tax=Mesorhizobium sp. M4B.F.Ca.ET.169.01.1.1 TaxID=2563949 RepID=UPI00109410DD|nr:hypothetical protein [Mesorhizobium sp. M4B.F.Ca.ET.169.01.1.1]TGT45389.1 hypothetical protein EN812_09630 [Mesorhizobium sp. M4B.F.Ca.ET.169.01.1.1]